MRDAARRWARYAPGMSLTVCAVRVPRIRVHMGACPRAPRCAVAVGAILRRARHYMRTPRVSYANRSPRIELILVFSKRLSPRYPRRPPRQLDGYNDKRYNEQKEERPCRKGAKNMSRKLTLFPKCPHCGARSHAPGAICDECFARRLLNERKTRATPQGGGARYAGLTRAKSI
jgi:hypothetical protein